MKSKLILLTDHDKWAVYNKEDEVYIPLIPMHDRYIKSLAPVYIRDHVISREFEYDIVNEFDNPYLFNGVPWGEGEIHARLLNTNPIETWHGIFLKYTHLSDSEFIEQMEVSYLPPKTKMPF
jgi:hypothetical protein